MLSPAPGVIVNKYILDAPLARGGMGSVWTVLRQLARGLRHAHEAGIVHRDLKPGNIFIARADDEEVVKILDFGIAKLSRAAPDANATRTGIVMGSVHYASPEQLRSSKDADFRSDLWSVGVILFRMVVGDLPFKGNELADIIVKVCAEPIPLASSLAPDLPASVDAFFIKALARRPAERFQTIAELVEAFAALGAGGAGAQAQPVAAALPVPAVAVSRPVAASPPAAPFPAIQPVAPVAARPPAAPVAVVQPVAPAVAPFPARPDAAKPPPPGVALIPVMPQPAPVMPQPAPVAPSGATSPPAPFPAPPASTPPEARTAVWDRRSVPDGLPVVAAPVLPAGVEPPPGDTTLRGPGVASTTSGSIGRKQSSSRLVVGFIAVTLLGIAAAGMIALRRGPEGASGDAMTSISTAVPSPAASSSADIEPASPPAQTTVTVTDPPSTDPPG